MKYQLKSKRIVTISALPILVAILAISSAQVGATQVPGSLKWHSAHAKATGQTSLKIGPDKEGYDYTPRFVEILKNSLLVSGTVTSISVDSSDGFHIWTWYRIQPVRKGRLPEKINRDTISPHIPSKILAANNSEMLIRVLGGTATVDGISLEESGITQLGIGKRYLFCLERTTAGFYNLAFGTKPILLDGAGRLQISTSDKSKYSGYLRSYKSFDDVMGYSTRLK